MAINWRYLEKKEKDEFARETWLKALVGTVILLGIGNFLKVFDSKPPSPSLPKGRYVVLVDQRCVQHSVMT